MEYLGPSCPVEVKSAISIGEHTTALDLIVHVRNIGPHTIAVQEVDFFLDQSFMVTYGTNGPMNEEIDLVSSSMNCLPIQPPSQKVLISQAEHVLHFEIVPRHGIEFSYLLDELSVDVAERVDYSENVDYITPFFVRWCYLRGDVDYSAVQGGTKQDEKNLVQGIQSEAIMSDDLFTEDAFYWPINIEAYRSGFSSSLLRNDEHSMFGVYISGPSRTQLSSPITLTVHVITKTNSKAWENSRLVDIHASIRFCGEEGEESDELFEKMKAFPRVEAQGGFVITGMDPVSTIELGPLEKFRCRLVISPLKKGLIDLKKHVYLVINAGLLDMEDGSALTRRCNYGISHIFSVT